MMDAWPHRPPRVSGRSSLTPPPTPIRKAGTLPHSAFGRSRRSSGSSSSGFPPFWAVTKHADVMEIERNPEIFTNAPLPVLTPKADTKAAGDVPVKTLIQMDGDEHKAHRHIVNNFFLPGSVRRMDERIEALAAHSIDHMESLGGRCDFASDVSLHFPLQVILSILGLPEGDFGRMLRLTQELFGAEDPDVGRLGRTRAFSRSFSTSCSTSPRWPTTAAPIRRPTWPP